MNKEVDDAVAQGTPRTADERLAKLVADTSPGLLVSVLKGELLIAWEGQIQELRRKGDDDRQQLADLVIKHSKRADGLSAQVVELQERIEQLTGMKFSDRMHAALRYRAETAEAKLKFLTENCDCKEIV